MPNSVDSFLTRQSSPDPGSKFDPFVVLEDHMEHYASTSIVKLKDSNKVFCPLCLEIRSSEDIDMIEESAYFNYIASLFEVLDQYGEEEQLRRIVLTILEIILPKRSLVLDRDDSFHQVLRVVNKLMNSKKYNINEFITLTKILSNTSIESVKPLPLRSAWEAWKKMLEFGQNISIEGLIDPNRKIPETVANIICAQAVIVKTYLSLVNSIAVDKVSDLVFTLYSRNKPESCIRKYYEESQIRCLKFTQDILFKNYSYLLMTDTEQLEDCAKLTISEFFGALCECFQVAVRQNDIRFLDWIDSKDFIGRIHSIYYNYPSLADWEDKKDLISDTIFSIYGGEHLMEIRSNLHGFLKLIIQFYIEKDYGIEEGVRDFIKNNQAIETSARKVMQQQDPDLFFSSLVFYVLINCVAIKKGSNYYKPIRVRAIYSVDNDLMLNVRKKLLESRVLMRAFAFVLASSHKEPTGSCPSKKFIRKTWRQMLAQRNFTEFREIFCYEFKVFDWAQVHPLFIALVDCDTIDYLLERGLKQSTLNRCLKNLLRNSSLRNVFRQYTIRSSDKLFEKINKMGVKKLDKGILEEFSSWLPALLQEIMLTYLSNVDGDPDNATICSRIAKMIGAMNLLLMSSKNFQPYLDDQFIVDFTRLVERLYQLSTPCLSEKQILYVAHDFMALLINFNNLCVMKLIQYMEFTLIGYMYNFLDHYTAGDNLVEAIARVLVAYDNLDYPLIHTIDKSLYLMPARAYDWMMSCSRDLHLLSLKLMEKVFLKNQSLTNDFEIVQQTLKVSLVTGFIHMVATNVELLQNHKTKLSAILKLEEFKFHPLFKNLLEMAPELSGELEPGETELTHSPPSPDMSFESEDTSLFEDEHISVTRILEQLHDEDGSRNTSNIPRNIYLSKAIDDEPTVFPGAQEWVRRAYAATQSSSGATQQTTQGSR